MQPPADIDPKELERQALNVNPGGWTVQNTRPIATLLGSCVAVCLFDPGTRLAGMNHFLLPSRTKAADDDPDVILAGDYSMEVLLNAMLNKGVNRRRIVAKAFGGGTIVTSIQMAIGERNSRFAADWLEREGIPLVASDFGGAWSRKVIFDPLSGDVFCRRMPTNQDTVRTLIQEEQAYANSLIKPAQSKRVELF
ncbi:MAG TPA: chemotaxis protein CheD [Rhodocyclaceae bacterium]